MAVSPLISCKELADSLNDSKRVIVDCRFSLGDTSWGETEYDRSHIPTAVYAHLDRDLSGVIIRGQTGRHPLPPVEGFAAKLGSWGIDNQSMVVAYDEGPGAFAARLWWLLRWLGHDRASVLDGGWAAWTQQDLPVSRETGSPKPKRFIAQPRNERVATASAVEEVSRDSRWRVVDSRAPERYRGEMEPIDAVPGHIPGAVNAPYSENLNDRGTFLSSQDLRERFQARLGMTPAEQTIFYCGSGVTAAQNVLAYVHAGLGEPKLYAGSWSEWITDPSRPVATG